MTPLFWKYLIVSAKRKKFVCMWVEIASHMDDLPVQFRFNELCKKHGYSRSGLHRHMEEVKQFWDKSGTNLGQTWYRGGVEFQSLMIISDTKLEQTWDKPDTKLKQQKRPKTQDDYEAVRQEVIDYLNDKTGKKYRTRNKQTKKDIDARLKEGYTYKDFCQVIDNKRKVWKGTQQEIYLRPVTLFGNKFDSYLNEHPQNPKLSMHLKISNHVTKAERYNNAINDADEIDFTQFVEPDSADKKNN
jgi:uncharacterized phage protein (TIGR02220 family)